MVPNRRTKRKSKNMDSHLLVTPAIFKPGSTVLKSMDSRLKISEMTEKYYKGALPPYKPPEKTKTQKDKGKRQKITRRKKPPCRHS